MARIRIVQPWSLTATRLAQEDDDFTADEVDRFTWLDLVWRLHLLDILDKHREVLALDFHRATISLNDDEFDPLDDGNEPEGEPINVDELDPETRENLFEALRKIQEQNARPDSFDFYDSDDFYDTTGEVHDGAEIGTMHAA